MPKAYKGNSPYTGQWCWSDRRRRPRSAEVSRGQVLLPATGITQLRNTLRIAATAEVRSVIILERNTRPLFIPIQSCI